jgi:hypothetical protein
VTSTLTIGGVAGSIALDVPTVTDNVNNMVVDNARPINPPTANLIAPITVLNQLTLTNGVIGTTPTNLLTLGTNAATGVTVGGSTGSYVSGPLRKFLDPSATFRYQVGSEGQYRQAELVTDVTSTANQPFTVRLLVGSPISYGRNGDFTAPVSFNVSKLEHHEVFAPTGGGAVLNRIRLWWGAGSVVSMNPLDYEKLFIVRWNGTAWDSTLAGGRGSAAGTFTNGVVTSRPNLGTTFSFQYFSIASTDQTNPLPVTWLAFTGQWEGPNARLDWSTASELNNERFEIERSLDQATWATIGTRPGSGTTSQTRNYAFVDADVPPGARVFYRIRQVDLDGRSSVSNVVALDRTGAPTGANAVAIYPNPFQTGTLNIVGAFSPAEQQGPFTLRILTTDGRVVSMAKGDFATAVNLARQAFDAAPAAIYLLVVESPNGVERHRVVKQ